MILRLMVVVVSAIAATVCVYQGFTLAACVWGVGFGMNFMSLLDKLLEKS